MKTFKQLIQTKYHDIHLEDRIIRQKVIWHNLEICNDDIWLFNNLFALRNDPKTILFLHTYFKRQEELLSEQKNYNLISMKLHPFKHNPFEQKNIYSGIKIEEMQTKKIEQILFENKANQTTEQKYYSAHAVSDFTKNLSAKIPFGLHTYILEHLQPKQITKKRHITYVNNNKEIIALIAPLHMF